MIEACRREIEELHAFFEGWFEGTLPDDEATFARVADALAEDFELISPDGRRRDRGTILASIREGYGDHAGEGKRFRIEIHDVRPRLVVAETALLTYEEWQTSDGSKNRRLSSAWFRKVDAAPCGVRWIHLHETALS
ncbi:MAG: DUF4440 domain-containing protein [Gemmatimonadota bacterium]|nr:DUF4440 domain-containing protein [Gemmatimonadota bacterium]